jgi:hypothetical protein
MQRVCASIVDNRGYHQKPLAESLAQAVEVLFSPPAQFFAAYGYLPVQFRTPLKKYPSPNNPAQDPHHNKNCQKGKRASVRMEGQNYEGGGAKRS